MLKKKGPVMEPVRNARAFFQYRKSDPDRRTFAGVASRSAWKLGGSRSGSEVDQEERQRDDHG
ncbi:MAG: hypothetical protein KDB77_14075, partial [Flavobacteriales bacterium]|nr:hypothetical protein [Flavobacteriales bacterium]